MKSPLLTVTVGAVLSLIVSQRSQLRLEREEPVIGRLVVWEARS